MTIPTRNDERGGKIRAAMILAAGRGERMRPLSDIVPKPLLRIHGKPLIERHVERLAAAGIERVVINLAWLGFMIRDHLGDGARYGVAIEYSDESAQVLETGGGIYRALPRLGAQPFLAVSGDVLTDYPFELLRLDAKSAAHLVLVPNPSHHPRGDFGLEAGLAVPSAAQQYTFGNIAAYSPEFFAGCVDGVFPLKPLLLRAMTAGRCSAEIYTGPWENVGTPAHLAALNAQGPV